MADSTGIPWCDSTFNPIRGCSKVSPACRNCYAEKHESRFGAVKWGPNGTRVLTSDANWQKPVRWNREAAAKCGPLDKDPGPRNPIKAGVRGSFAMSTGRVVSGLIVNTSTGLMVRDEVGGGLFAASLLSSFSPPRPRVFCASLADVFESWDGPIVDSKGNQLWHSPVGWISAGPGEQLRCVDGPVTLDDVRKRLFGLIDATPELNWLLLTKRPENIRRMWPELGGNVPDWAQLSGSQYRPNVWIGCSVENQEYADKRIPELLKCRDLSPVLWLSCEPLLGPLELEYPESLYPHGPARCCGGYECGCQGMPIDPPAYLNAHFGGVDWVVCGGESGPGSRSMDLGWVRSLKNQCDASGVPFFMKQLSQVDTPAFKRFEEFPEDLQVREFPNG